MSAVTCIDGYAVEIDAKRRVFVGKMMDAPDDYVIDFTNENYPDDPNTRLYISGEALSALGYLIEMMSDKHGL